jgi:hypothetical protein
MMMMFLARDLIKSSQFGRMDLLKPPLFDQKLEIAIYGCLVQRAHHPAPGLENFFNTQGAIGFKEYILDGIPLIRFPLHYGSHCT